MAKKVMMAPAPVGSMRPMASLRFVPFLSAEPSAKAARMMSS